MVNNKKILWISLVILVFLYGQAFAADRYMATTGTDSGTCTVEASPCLTLQYAMTQMNGGDTLYIADGNYTTSANTINQNNVPPSGSPGAFTVIRATNIPCQDGVACNQALKVKFSGDAVFAGTNTASISYVKFWGIRWNGIATYAGWDNLYFKQVASQGVEDGNTSSISISGQDNLLEDVIAFGKGRYKILFYDPSRELQTWGDGNNLCRRCVVRHDWASKNDVAAQNIAGITSYFNRGTACLNCIVIDSDTPSEWQDQAYPAELAGAFYQPNDEGAHAFRIQGSIVINTAMAVLYNRKNSSGHIVRDVVAVKVAGGLGLRGDTDVDRVTFIDVGMNNFTYRSAQQEGILLAPDDGILSVDGSHTLNDSIMRDIADDGVDGSGVTSDYINMFQIGGTQYVGSTQATNFITTDPFLNGLTYPPRIEAASTLLTQGSGGGQIGARIVNKLGIDGTFKGDTDWDTEQGSLWPWPLEAWIKAEMKTSEYTTDADRGFCADGQTLTAYIWEYLGNACPVGICDSPPSPPLNLTIVP